MAKDRISEAAVRQATGRGWQEWFTILDGWGASDMDHTSIARRLEDEPKLSGWWRQAVTVEYERVRGLRQVNEGPKGWQFSVQKTLPLSTQAAWDALMHHDWLPTDAPEEGMSLSMDGDEITVRAVRPRDLLRLWWYHPQGRSTLEVGLAPKDERTVVRFMHQALPEEAMVEAWRQKWRRVLDELAT